MFHLTLKDAAEPLTKPNNNTQHMDYGAEKKGLARPSYKPGHIMVIDDNLVMAHARLKSVTPYTVTNEWVM